MLTDSMTLLVDASLRAAAVLAAGWTLAAVLRRASASTRHFLWVCTIAAAALVPVTAIVTPDWTVHPPPGISAMAPVWTGTSTAVAERRNQVERPPAPFTPAADRATSAPSAQGSRAERVEPVTVLLSVWAVGAAAVVLYMLIGFTAVSRLRRSAHAATGAWVDEATALAEAFDVPPSVVFMESAMIRMPIVCGAWRPAVIIPAAARDWPPERLRVAVLHELAHIRRRDCLTQAIARIVCAVYWFNPLTWIAARHLRAERERACDDFVLAAGTRGSEYAGHLLDIARAPGRRFSLLASAGVPMAHRSQLEGRLMAILDPAVRRSSATYTRAAALIAMALISIPVAALQPQERTAPPRDVALSGPAAGTAPAASVQDGTVPDDVTISVNVLRERRADLERAAQNVRAALEGAGQPSPAASAQGAATAPKDFFVGDRRVRLDRSRSERALDRALLEAAEEGDVQGINDLLAAGADVNAPIGGDGSALIVAARHGRVEIVRLLLDRGADPNMGVEGDGNPLIMAAREGYAAVVELLLQRGASVNQAVDGDENALIQASGAGRLDMVKLLVSRGADVNARFLVARSRVDQEEREEYDNLGRRRVIPVRRLVSRQEWRSALSMARQGGHDAVVAYLISVGAQD